MRLSKRVAGFMFGILIISVFALDLHHHLTLENIKTNLHTLQTHQQDHPVASVVIYMTLYITGTALSLPVGGILTLIAGALFGLVKGVIIVSFASTIGATLAFLVARFFLRDTLRKRFRHKVEMIDRGVEREGGFYLFSLRLVPIFPFFILNILMGVTAIPTLTYAWVSQLGMLPATAVFVNAGKALSQLESLHGILSPGLMAAFALLGIFPIAAKKTLGLMRRKNALNLTDRSKQSWPDVMPAPPKHENGEGYFHGKELDPINRGKTEVSHERPKKFDYNLVVIGAGSAGLVSSYIAATIKAKVALIERHKMGGDCLNTGCVPSKALIKSGRVLSLIRRAKDFGLDRAEVTFDFEKVMKRVHDTIDTVVPHDSIERYTDLGVTCIEGEATILSPYHVRVTPPAHPGSDHPGSKHETILTTRSIIIATGAKPTIPDLPGLDTVPYHTSDTIWQLRQLPKRLLVLGGGPIGCELAQTFSNFGAKVTLIQRGDRLMKREDPEVSQLIQKIFQAQGITVLTGHTAKAVSQRPSNPSSQSEFVMRAIEDGKNGDDEITVPFDTLLVALGRTPNVTGLGLEALGITLSKNGTIENSPFLETSIPNIFCAGDVAGPYQFTHTAAHQSWYATVNALFGGIKKFKADYRTIPWATFTHPEVARVGLNEIEARANKIPYEVTRYDIDDLDRAIADSETCGFVKVLTPPGKDKILGVTLVGQHAGETISEFILAMKHGLGLNKILGTIHIYPTMAEANKYVAGQWKKAHAPKSLLKWIERFHTWMRGR